MSIKNIVPRADGEGSLGTTAKRCGDIETKKLTSQGAVITGSVTAGGFKSSCTGAEVTYDSDKETQLTMQGIALNVNTELFAENYPTGCPVRGYAAGSETKTVYMLTPEQVMRWCADLSMHIGNCKVAGWQKQAEVEAAQTAAEIEDITL